MINETTPVIKGYKDFTGHERMRYNTCWVNILDTYCRADEEECRPCDRGALCDLCHYDRELQREFAKRLVFEGIPLTPANLHYLTSE